MSLDLPISRERAYELTEAIPIGATYHCAYKGPNRLRFWRACFVRDRRSLVAYVGSDDRRRELEAAHAFVRDELAREVSHFDPLVLETLRRHSRYFADVAMLATIKKIAPARATNGAGALGGPPDERQAVTR